MQGIIFNTIDATVKRGDVLPVYIHNEIVCDFKVESFTDTQVIGDFTINVETNLQFIITGDTEGQLKIVPSVF